MRFATSPMLVRNFGSGNAITLKVISASATGLLSTSIFALVIAYPEPSWSKVALSESNWPGRTNVRSFASLTPETACA